MDDGIENLQYGLHATF